MKIHDLAMEGIDGVAIEFCSTQTLILFSSRSCSNRLYGIVVQCVVDGETRIARQGSRHDDPFAVEPHAIVAVLRIPIDVVDPEAVGERAAESLAAREPGGALLDY